MELWQWLGALHPKLVQFPLVLLLVGLLFDAAGLIWRSARAHWAGLLVSGMGTLGLLFAFICGIYAEVWAGRAGVPQHPIELHELMANIASWGFVVLFAWRLFLGVGNRPGATTLDSASRSVAWMRGYVIAGGVWYALLVLTGYLGGLLVFEYGAGIADRGALSGMLSLSDLNTLAQRQTDENLRYSEWMHHIFGWLTLGLAASLMAQALWPGQAKRLRWIVPTFLLAGGFFLFFMADRDLYALTDPRQWRDREVQLHKTLATVMAVIGASGLWRLRKKSGDRSQKPEGEGEKPAEKASNSKLVAALALIGGAMLFTHVHSVAPYANVAAGVYIAHVVMGLIALSIGAARVAQDVLPHWKKSLAVVFATLMLIESVLLISYNEGLPWYIGYGRYNRWGPNESRAVTIAPFGDFRAAMFVDSGEGRVVVALRDRYSDKDVVLKLDDAPELLLGTGGPDVSLRLARSASDDGRPLSGPPFEGSNFRASADFLKRAVFLNAQLILHLNGRRLVGYFDPWVTPAIAAVPPNELAKFECPMHEAMRSVNGGRCPLCGMEMVTMRPPRPAGELHDPEYNLRVSPVSYHDGQWRATLQPVLMPEGATLRDLAIVHEQPIHLMVVSEDLSYFDHVHPVPSDDPRLLGQYVWQYRFPRPGRYVLFVEFTPSGGQGGGKGRAQAFRVPLAVDDAGVRVSDQAPIQLAVLALDSPGAKLMASIAAPFTPQDSAPLDLRAGERAHSADMQVQMLSQPRTLYAGLHTDLLFRLSDAQGRPITDLIPYLGAMGHCAIISQDTQTFLHSHPEQIWTPAAGEKGGPEVAFHALFPKAGRYRIWAQFKRAASSAEVFPPPPAPAPSGLDSVVRKSGGDRMIIAEFTVEVKDPPVPASLIRFLLNE